MKITNARVFEQSSKKLFGMANISSLSGSSDKIRFDLGGDFESDQRVEIAHQRASEVLTYIYNKKEIWIKITLWSKKDEQELESLLNKSDIIFQKETKGQKLIYLYFEQFELSIVDPLIKAIIGFELGYDYGLNITCLYYNFEIPALTNIYDDRGMDIVIINEKSRTILKAKFENFLNTDAR